MHSRSNLFYFIFIFLLQAFAELDADGDGYIGNAELKAGMERLLGRELRQV